MRNPVPVKHPTLSFAFFSSSSSSSSFSSSSSSSSFFFSSSSSSPFWPYPYVSKETAS